MGTAQFNLTDLNGSNGFIINGIAGGVSFSSGDSSGGSVSGAGDINGDGIDDVIIGAPLANSNGNNAAGQSYVVFGSRSGFSPSLNLSSLNGSNGFAINGIAVDSSEANAVGAGGSLGGSVSGAGDINGDGIDDLIIGARNQDADGKIRAGQSYVVFGTRSGFSASFNVSDLNGSNGFAINGIAVRDASGHSVSGAGDVNGDGIDDLIIGAFGSGPSRIDFGANQSYVVFGSRSGFSASLNLSSLNGRNGFIFNGGLFDGTGFSASGAGDINGDGLNDLIIGAEDASPNGLNGAGQSYVVFGSRSFSSFIDYRDLNGSNGFTITGAERRSRTGVSVSGAGDVNGDGIDDLIIGAEVASPNGIVSSGQSYVVFGSRSGFGASFNLSSLDGNNGYALNGIAIDDQSGTSVSGSGDVNGDGVDDLIIGADQADPNGLDGAGQSYVVFGVRSGTNRSPVIPGNTAPVAVDDTVTANQTAPKIILGSTLLANDTDLNGDRLTITSVGNASQGSVALVNDAILYTPDPTFDGTATFDYSLIDGNGGSDTGQVTVLIGKTQRSSNRGGKVSGTSGDDSLTGRKGNDRLSGQAGNDFLSGSRGKDTLNGGNGADILNGGQNADRLTGGSDADTFVLATLRDSLLSGYDRITDLEIGSDSIDAPSIISAGQVVQRGAVRKLSTPAIAAVLTPRAFAANGAATFTVGTGRQQQTFLALNNSTAGFSANADALINITGYSGRLADLAIG